MIAGDYGLDSFDGFFIIDELKGLLPLKELPSPENNKAADKGGSLFPATAAEAAAKLEVTPEALLHSMGRLEYTTDIGPKVVQETIDYLQKLGYIKSSFKAENIQAFPIRNTFVPQTEQTP